MVLLDFQHPLGRDNILNLPMLESIPSASDAAWQSVGDPILCSPLLSHVPDDTVSLSTAYVEAGHAREQYDWPTIDVVVTVVLPTTQSVQLVCPVEPPVDFPTAHGVQLVDPGDAELLPAGHGRQTVGDDEDELSMKDPAGQVEASAQFVKQMHGYPPVPHGLPL